MNEKTGHSSRDFARYLPCIPGAYFLVLFHVQHGWPGHVTTPITDAAFLGLAVLFLLIPFVARLSVGKLIEFERDLKSTRKELTETRAEVLKVLSVVSTSISANIGNTYITGTPVSGTTETQSALRDGSAATITRMQYKILRTLWTHQVNRYADLSAMFTFRIHTNAMEYVEVRDAGTTLISRGLIDETPEGQYVLSLHGLKYCLDHYKEFPPDKWFEPAAIDEDKVSTIRSAVERFEHLVLKPQQ
jgi:hypothetical protein